MAWNEPGNSGDKDKNRDPWSNRPGNKQGPPNLDEVFKNLQKKLAGIFGGGSGKGGNGSSGGANDASAKGILMLLGAILALWLVYDMTYRIDQSERGMVTRLGKYVDTLSPGMTLRFPRPIEYVQKVNISQIQTQDLKAQLLTKDMNLISISLVVQFKVNDEYKYAFKVRQPAETLRQSIESALREVVGGNTLDDILSKRSGRDKLGTDVKAQIQLTIDKFETGLLVDKVNLDDAQVPTDVQEAFQDAVKADKDDDRYIEEAKAFVQDILPKAEGDSQRLIEEASAYRQQIVNKADGETSRFLQTLREYRKAPEITRKRIYIETMEHVLTNTSKVMIKVNKGNNIMYLPLDRIISNSQNSTALPPGMDIKQESPTISTPAPAPGVRSRERDNRSR